MNSKKWDPEYRSGIRSIGSGMWSIGSGIRSIGSGIPNHAYVVWSLRELLRSGIYEVGRRVRELESEFTWNLRRNPMHENFLSKTFWVR